MAFSKVARAAYRRVALGLAAAFLAALAVPSPAAAALTLAEAQRLAVARSRQVVAQDLAVTASREMAVAAAQLPDPVATVGVNNLPVNGPDAWSLTRDFMTMTNIGVMQEFTRGEKRQARAERFEREAEKTSAERAARVALIQRDTALAWLDRYYAEAQAALIAEQSAQARLEIEAAETAYRTGRGGFADVLSARSVLAGLNDRASELGRRVNAAKIALARWVGEAATAPLAGTPAIDAIPLDSHDVDADIARHPEMAVFSRQEDLAAAEVRAAQASKKPDWSVQLMYSQRGSAYSNMISVNFSVPLQWDQTNRQDREVAAKLALLDQARAEREEALRAHASEVKLMIAEWENDRERNARYQRELIPLATERTQALLAAYRGAKATLTELLAARRNEIDVRQQALQLEMETARVWAQLNFLAPVGDEGRSDSTYTKDRP